MVSKILPSAAHAFWFWNRTSATCSYLPTRAAATAYVAASLASGYGWSGEILCTPGTPFPAAQTPASDDGSICMCSPRQAGHWKSLKSSMVTGAAGFPKVFAGSIREGAARQRASARNKIADGFISHHFTCVRAGPGRLPQMVSLAVLTLRGLCVPGHDGSQRMHLYRRRHQI